MSSSSLPLYVCSSLSLSVCLSLALSHSPSPSFFSPSLSLSLSLSLPPSSLLPLSLSLPPSLLPFSLSLFVTFILSLPKSHARILPEWEDGSRSFGRLEAS